MEKIKSFQMKIGILTLPLSYNYGGILQAFALQNILERMGHEAVVVEKDRYLPSDVYHQARSYMSYVLHGFKGKTNWAYNKAKKEREKYTRDFINKYVNSYKVKDMALEFPKDVDAIIVGSDQIWRRQYFCEMIGGGIENAFLSFTKKWNIKRLSYAASFGTDNWEYSVEESKVCNYYLQFFDAVSVREKSGVDLCAKWLGRNDAKLVLDPTLLLQQDDYVKLIEKAKVPSSEGKLMVYVLDDSLEKNELVYRIAQERGLKPFKTNLSDDVLKRNPNIAQPPLEYWLRGFMDSDFVVTDSFHACVFSLIFKKPFVVVGNAKRGMSRFDSLLSMFSLQDHLLKNIADYKPGKSYGISDNSYCVIEEMRRESLDYLFSALK